MIRSEGGHEIAEYIRSHGLDLYGQPEDPSSRAYFSNEILQHHLSHNLVGISLANLPLRTRSKVAKESVCTALGYHSPSAFRKTRPRFPSPNLDIYVQKADNLQIWNQEIDPLRRYVVIGLDQADRVYAVRVLSGQELALLDNTGTLTSKYQAKRRASSLGTRLVSEIDTADFRFRLSPVDEIPSDLRLRLSPLGPPKPGAVLSIAAIYRRLKGLEDEVFLDPGSTQERLRGVLLQQRVCQLLELGSYADAGQFPDIQSQALEVKLQLSPTVDLGLISPDSDTQAKELGSGLAYRDSRYAVAYAAREGERFRVHSVVVTTGADFFSEFRRFEGNVQNRKLQIRLPRDFFVTP
jgi:hypothetical protein